jgi:hypothetical protein
MLKQPNDPNLVVALGVEDELVSIAGGSFVTISSYTVPASASKYLAVGAAIGTFGIGATIQIREDTVQKVVQVGGLGDLVIISYIGTPGGVAKAVDIRGHSGAGGSGLGVGHISKISV